MKEFPDLDRRNFMLGRPSETSAEIGSESHVSSLIVHVWPERADAVAEAIGSRRGAEVHARDPIGKLIVTLETENEFEIVQHLNAIQDLSGVLSTALVFHLFESESA